MEENTEQRIDLTDVYKRQLEGDYLAKLAFDGAKRIYGEPLTEEVKERMNFDCLLYTSRCV